MKGQVNVTHNQETKRREYTQNQQENINNPGDSSIGNMQTEAQNIQKYLKKHE